MVFTKFKRKVRNLFGFSKLETNGMLLLIPINTVLLLGYIYIKGDLFYARYNQQSDIKKLDSISNLFIKASMDMTNKIDVEGSRISKINNMPVLVNFNPNDVTHAQLLQLGIRKDVANKWVKYLKNGGHFDKVDQVKRIYGLTDSTFLILKPFIVLPEQTSSVNLKAKKDFSSENTKISTFNTFDINLADTIALQNIRGIGKILSKRIAKYRDLLGGFVTLDQLFEVYGLDSIVATKLIEQSFLEDSFTPKKININITTKKELSSHPYISNKMADLIIAYRSQHGNYTDLSPLKTIPLVLTSFHKISPYLTVKD